MIIGYRDNKEMLQGRDMTKNDVRRAKEMINEDDSRGMTKKCLIT